MSAILQILHRTIEVKQFLEFDCTDLIKSLRIRLVLEDLDVEFECHSHDLSEHAADFGVL